MSRNTSRTERHQSAEHSCSERCADCGGSERTASRSRHLCVCRSINIVRSVHDVIPHILRLHRSLNCLGLQYTSVFFTSDNGGGTCFRPRAAFVCLSVCLCARLLKNAFMNLDEMLCVDRCRDMDELINF